MLRNTTVCLLAMLVACSSGEERVGWFTLREIKAPAPTIEGTAVQVEFRFENSEKRSRRILRAQMSCGCMNGGISLGGRRYAITSKGDVTEFVENGQVIPYIEVRPSEKGEVTFNIDTRGKEGQLSTRTYLDTADPADGRIALDWSGEIIPKLRAEPKEVHFKFARWDRTERQSVTISSPVLDQFELVEIEGLPTGVLANSTRITDNKWKIEIAYGPLCNENARGCIVSVRGDRKDLGVRIPIVVHREEVVSFRPAQVISLREEKTGSGLEGHVCLQAVDGQELRIVSIRIESSSVPESMVSLKEEQGSVASERCLRIHVRNSGEERIRVIRVTIRLRINRSFDNEHQIVCLHHSR